MAMLNYIECLAKSSNGKQFQCNMECQILKLVFNCLQLKNTLFWGIFNSQIYFEHSIFRSSNYDGVGGVLLYNKI